MATSECSSGYLLPSGNTFGKEASLPEMDPFGWWLMPIMFVGGGQRGWLMLEGSVHGDGRTVGHRRMGDRLLLFQ